MNIMAVCVGNKYYFFLEKDIQYLKFEDGISKIFLKNGKVYESLKSLKKIESALNASIFFRSNANCIVNINYIERLSINDSENYLKIGNQSLPISRRKKSELLSRFMQNNEDS